MNVTSRLDTAELLATLCQCVRSLLLMTGVEMH
jgi:hypothetical protein